MRLRSLLLVALAAVALLSARPGFAAGDLSLFGVRPGMAATEVRRVLGKPAVERQAPPTWCYRIGVGGQDDPTVMFDPSSRVRFVLGSKVELDGKPFLARGITIPELKAALGEPSATRPGEGTSLLYIYGPRKLIAVVAGSPGRVVVFGLGDAPR